MYIFLNTHDFHQNSTSKMRLCSRFPSLFLILFCIEICLPKQILGQDLSGASSPSKGCLPDSGDIGSQRTRTINPIRLNAVTGGRIECVNKEAQGYPCSNIHLESFLPLSQLGDEFDVANG